MDILSWVLLGLIVGWIVAAVLHLVRHGSCSCGSNSCTSCSTCTQCKKCKNKRHEL